MVEQWAINICHLEKKFEKKTVKAIDRVSLDIKTGEILCLLGPNGAGKTTLIKSILGLVQPTKGDIYVMGYHLKTERRKVLRNVGAVLEGNRNIYWNLTTDENLKYFSNLKGLSGRAIKDKINHLIDLFDLKEKRNTLLRNMSRGMQQKVAIAVALLADPPVLLLDEPTLGLDVNSSVIIKEMIKYLVKEEGKTILLTTHQLDLAQELCDRVAIIKKGKLLVVDEIKNLLEIFSIKEYHLKLKLRTEETMQKFKLFDFVEIIEEEDETEIIALTKNSEELYRLVNFLQEERAEIISINENTDLERIFIHFINQQEVWKKYA